jgi:hypothetical protein
MTTPSTVTFTVTSKSSAGPDTVNVAFVEVTQPGASGVTYQQSFNRTLPQAEADAYEINSQWVQSLTAVTPTTTSSTSTSTSTTSTPPSSSTSTTGA